MFIERYWNLSPHGEMLLGLCFLTVATSLFDFSAEDESELLDVLREHDVAGANDEFLKVFVAGICADEHSWPLYLRRYVGHVPALERELIGIEISQHEPYLPDVELEDISWSIVNRAVDATLEAIQVSFSVTDVDANVQAIVDRLLDESKGIYTRVGEQATYMGASFGGGFTGMPVLQAAEWLGVEKLFNRESSSLDWELAVGITIAEIASSVEEPELVRKIRDDWQQAMLKKGRLTNAEAAGEVSIYSAALKVLGEIEGGEGSHSHAEEMPNLHGMKLDKAKVLCESLGLNPVVRDHKYLSLGADSARTIWIDENWRVSSQKPTTGKPVPGSRTIELYVNRVY